MLSCDESDLIKSGQTAEEAFNHFITTRGEKSDHHGSLQRMLKAQSKVHKINENCVENEGVVVVTMAAVVAKFETFFF